MLQGIWWDRSLDGWMFLETDFMISILASSHIYRSIQSHHFMPNRWGNETVRDFIFLGFKITADGDCSHKIKRCLLLGVRDGWEAWHDAVNGVTKSRTRLSN